MEVNFKTRCPTKHCFKEGNINIIYWVDSGCGHQLKLTRHGTLKCIGPNCYNNCERDLLCLRFKCDKHEKERSWDKNGNYQYLITAIVQSIMMELGEEGEGMAKDVLMSLNKQREKYGYN